MQHNNQFGHFLNLMESYFQIKIKRVNFILTQSSRSAFALFPKEYMISLFLKLYKLQNINFKTKQIAKHKFQN